MRLHVAGALSALDRDRMAPGARPERVIEVPTRTLDDVLLERTGIDPERGKIIVPEAIKLMVENDGRRRQQIKAIGTPTREA